MFDDEVSSGREPDEERFRNLAADLVKRQRRRVRNRHVKDLVSRIIARRGFSQQETSEEIASAWRDSVGKKIAAGSRPGSLQRGTLQIEVNNSIFAQEIEFTKSKIVKALQSRLPDAGIERLRVRVG